MKTRAFLLPLLLFTLAGPASHAQDAPPSTSILETPNYRIYIEEHCQYDVNCQKVKYVGISKRTGKSITLWGRRTVRMCADGVTPCSPIGYEFKNKDFTYEVLDSPGRLYVTRGQTTLINELGQWR